MSEHTPGPWQAVNDWGRIVGDRRPSSVCHCGDWTVATVQPSYEFHGTDEADARLIAAAPDMLAALKALKAEIDRLKWGQPYPGRPHAIMDAAETAIAKAEGRK